MLRVTLHTSKWNKSISCNSVSYYEEIFCNTDVMGGGFVRGWGSCDGGVGGQCPVQCDGSVLWSP